MPRPTLEAIFTDMLLFSEPMKRRLREADALEQAVRAYRDAYRNYTALADQEGQFTVADEWRLSREASAAHKALFALLPEEET